MHLNVENCHKNNEFCYKFAAITLNSATILQNIQKPQNFIKNLDTDRVSVIVNAPVSISSCSIMHESTSKETHDSTSQRKQITFAERFLSLKQILMGSFVVYTKQAERARTYLFWQYRKLKPFKVFSS